ncbi:phosphatidylglycerol lysyltransferase domain-containing protein, partial [Clostridioides difficile]
EVVEFLKEKYPGRFEYIEERDLFDYIYDAESLRTLAGKKNQKKRNHINYFLKEYAGRYEAKLLDKENFDECLVLMKEWESNKEENNEFDESMDDELIGIKKIFNHYDILKDKVKVFGVYVDGKLEAFSIGELLNPNMALIHIEKANPDIRGLYPFINQQFLVSEFKDVEFVNREEDLGIEGLRKAKLSYHPCRFVEKYSVREA